MLELTIDQRYHVIKEQIIYELTIGKQYLSKDDVKRLKKMISKYVPLTDITYIKEIHIRNWPFGENLLDENED